MPSYSSTVVIEALDSNNNATTTLTLIGSGLPKQGAAYPQESSMSTTWYAGNPDDATQQVLVAKDLPSEWEGIWSYTRLLRTPASYSGPLGDQPQAVSPGFLCDVIESLMRAGSLLRVTWTVLSADPNVSRTVMRLGRIRRWTPKYIRSTDIDWQIAFEWKSRGATQSKIVATRDSDPASAVAVLSTMQDAATSLQNSAPFVSSDPTVPGSAVTLTLGQLEAMAEDAIGEVTAFLSSFGDTVGQLQQVAALSAAQSTVPYQFAASAVAITRSAMESCNDFQDTMGQRPPDLYSLSADPADICRAFAYFASFDDQLTLAAQSAFDATLQIRDPLANGPGGLSQSVMSASTAHQGSILAIHVARAGDTPELLAMLYYGNVDADTDILRANGLPWHQVSFDVGSPVVIPVLSTNKGP